MWCIPKLTDEFITRMEDVLTLYEKPYNPDEPVICFDEKSKQLLKDTRAPILAKPHRSLKRDYTYKRNGTRNIFMSIEPKGGQREARETARRTRIDFATEVNRVIRLPRYRKAKTIHLVADNLNTHNEKSFIETFGEKKAKRILFRIRFHYTPKHASWLNMAETELSIIGRQCLKRRIPTKEMLKKEIAIWQRNRNRARATINWKFTAKDARRAFKY